MYVRVKKTFLFQQARRTQDGTPRSRDGIGEDYERLASYEIWVTTIEQNRRRKKCRSHRAFIFVFVVEEKKNFYECFQAPMQKYLRIKTRSGYKRSGYRQKAKNTKRFGV